MLSRRTGLRTRLTAEAHARPGATGAPAVGGTVQGGGPEAGHGDPKGHTRRQGRGGRGRGPRGGGAVRRGREEPLSGSELSTQGGGPGSFLLLGSSLPGLSLLTVCGPRLRSGPGGAPRTRPSGSASPCRGEASRSSPCGMGRAQGCPPRGHRARSQERSPRWSFKRALLVAKSRQCQGSSLRGLSSGENPAQRLPFPGGCRVMASRAEGCKPTGERQTAPRGSEPGFLPHPVCPAPVRGIQ